MPRRQELAARGDPAAIRLDRRTALVLLTLFAADGAYDKRSAYAALQQHQPAPPIRVIIPPRVDAKLSRTAAEIPTPRDEHIMAVRLLGRKRWERVSGYTRRSVVEVAMYRFKTLVGRSLRGRSLERQGTETKIGGKVLNIMGRLTLTLAREALAA